MVVIHSLIYTWTILHNSRVILQYILMLSCIIERVSLRRKNGRGCMGDAQETKYTIYGWGTANSLENMKAKASRLHPSMRTESKIQSLM